MDTSKQIASASVYVPALLVVGIFVSVLAVVVVQLADLLPHVAAPVHQHLADAGQILHRLLPPMSTVYIPIIVVVVIGHVLCFGFVVTWHWHIRVRCTLVVVVVLARVVDQSCQFMIAVAITVVIVVVGYRVHLVCIDIL